MADELEGQEPEAPEAPAVPEAPVVEDASQRFGWDPDLARSQFEELRRREREVERRERDSEQKLREAQRPRYQEVPLESMDPSVAYLARMIQDDREERRLEREERQKERDREQATNRLGQQLDSSYKAAAKQSGLTQEQIKAQEGQFYELLTDLYPEPSMIQAIGPDEAVRRAIRYFKPSANGGAQPIARPGPRAAYVVPVGSTGGNTVTSNGIDTSPKKPGETIEQYSARIEQAGRTLQDKLRESGPVSLPDRYSSG